jgi:hypothetical protein
LSARIVGLSLAMREHAKALERALAKTSLPEDVWLVLGGSGASQSIAKRLGALYAGPELRSSVETVRVLAV